MLPELMALVRVQEAMEQGQREKGESNSFAHIFRKDSRDISLIGRRIIHDIGWNLRV